MEAAKKVRRNLQLLRKELLGGNPNPGKFEKALGRISDYVTEVKSEFDLSDLEVRDILELVRSDYV